MTLPRSRTSALLAGVSAGSVAAIVASLISLPLDSPDDLLFNTFTVTIGALVAGFGGGFVWWIVRDRPKPINDLWIVATGALVVVGIVGIVGQIAVFDRMFGFVMILGATVLAIVALLIPPFDQIRPALAAVLLVAAVAIGIGFAGQGDEESGELSLSETSTEVEPAAQEEPAADSTGSTATAEPPVGGSELTLPDDVAGDEFAVLPSESEVTYTIDETLRGLSATAVGRTSELSGTLRLDGASEVTIDLSTFTSDQSRRDSFVRGQMFNDPIATLSVESLDLPASYVEGEIVETTFNGAFTIQGVSQPVTWTAQARLTGNRLEVAADTDITFSQFELQAPNTGFVQVEDEIHIEVLVVADA